MRFSVVIPTFYSPKLNQVLDSVLVQTYPIEEYEIIVVGIDHSVPLLSDDRVRFDQTERRYSPAEARNRGAVLAKGEIVAFLDSDCIASPNWLKTLELNFRSPDVVVVGGGVAFEEHNYWTLADNLSMFHEFLVGQKPGPRRFLPSLNFAIYRDLFVQAGGFDPSYPIPAGEDTDMTLRLSQKGYILWFEPEAWVLHLPSRHSPTHLIRHAYYQGMYSPKLKPENTGEDGLPFYLRSPFVLIITSPILAFAATLRVFIRQPRLLRFFWIIPAIYLAKLIWCCGAAHSPVFGRKA